MPSPIPRQNPWVHGSLTSPGMAAFPELPAGRLLHWIFRGLLGVHSRYGLRTRQVTLSDPLHRRLQLVRYLHSCSDYYRLERQFAGWDSHPREDRAFARRTVTTILPIWASLPPHLYNHLAPRINLAGA
jgi:hypothetical protein